MDDLGRDATSVTNVVILQVTTPPAFHKCPNVLLPPHGPISSPIYSGLISLLKPDFLQVLILLIPVIAPRNIRTNKTVMARSLQIP